MAESTEIFFYNPFRLIKVNDEDFCIFTHPPGVGYYIYVLREMP